MRKKIVIFGGGTGLSGVLGELKNEDIDLTAVVTIADNGGSTGKIRNYYDIPAPGDIRRCVLALSENKELKNLMNYRFDKQIDNHTIGNLILTAFNDINGNMESAVKEYSKLLKVKQTVLPISNDSLQLCAKMKSGVEIHGENQITKYPEKIEHLFYENNPEILPKVLEKVRGADIIIFSCGSLFTSVISNLLFKDLIKVLDESDAKIIYINNLMTQRGETETYDVADHINALNKYLNNHKVDVVIVNTNYDIDNDIIKHYCSQQSNLVKLNIKRINRIEIIKNDYIIIDQENHIRHNLGKITKDLMKYINKERNE